MRITLEELQEHLKFAVDFAKQNPEVHNQQKEAFCLIGLAVKSWLQVPLTSNQNDIADAINYPIIRCPPVLRVIRPLLDLNSVRKLWWETDKKKAIALATEFSSFTFRPTKIEEISPQIEEVLSRDWEALSANPLRVALKNWTTEKGKDLPADYFQTLYYLGVKNSHLGLVNLFPRYPRMMQVFYEKDVQQALYLLLQIMSY